MEEWNGGILEGWFLKGSYPFLILSSTQILPLIQNCIIPEPLAQTVIMYPQEQNFRVLRHCNRKFFMQTRRTRAGHYSNIPAFHHSNWGEAPNL